MRRFRPAVLLGPIEFQIWEYWLRSCTALVKPSADTFSLCSDRVHDTDRINKPGECRLPVNRHRYAFQRFVCRDLISVFFAADTSDRVREQSIFSVNFKLDRRKFCLFRYVFHYFHLLQNMIYRCEQIETDLDFDEKNTAC